MQTFAYGSLPANRFFDLPFMGCDPLGSQHEIQGLPDALLNPPSPII
jgi:hypothetical protein